MSELAASVVLATFNRGELLARTLATVFAQSFPPSRYEVVVVDDGSSDDTPDYLRSLESPVSLHVLSQPNSGQTMALNRGIQSARGRLILFLDDDMLCHPDWLAEHVSAHGGSHCVVFGQTRWSEDSRKTRLSEAVRTYFDERCARLNQDPRPRYPDDALVGPNCSLARSLLQSHGGYDEKLLARRWEDRELGARLWKAGIPFLYRRSAIADHIYVKSRANIHRTAPIDGSSLVRLCGRHPEFRKVHLGRMVEGGVAKRLFRHVTLRFPALWERLLGAVAAVARLTGNAGLRIAERASDLRASVSFWSSAAAEKGGNEHLWQEFGRVLPILCYQCVSISAPASHPQLTVPLRQFEQQIRWLVRRGYRSITVAEWQEWRERGTPLPHRPVIITFDDAYQATARYAFPLLKRYSFGATMFVSPKLVGKTTPCDGEPAMDASSIRAWAVAGMEFGARWPAYADPTSLSDAQVDQEIAASKTELENMAGTTVRCFALPDGAYHGRILRSPALRCFDLAFTTDDALNTLATSDYRHHRSRILPRCSLLDFALFLMLGWSPLARLRDWLDPKPRLGRLVRRVTGRTRSANA